MLQSHELPVRTEEWVKDMSGMLSTVVVDVVRDQHGEYVKVTPDVLKELLEEAGWNLARSTSS